MKRITNCLMDIVKILRFIAPYIAGFAIYLLMAMIPVALMTWVVVSVLQYLGIL